MSSDPSYLQNLQAQGNAQGLFQLRTLAVEFSSTLAKFPRAKAELDALLHEQDGFDYSLLAERVERQLTDLTALEAFIDLIPASAKTKPKTNAILEGALGAAGLRTATSILTEAKHLMTEEANSPAEQAHARTITNLKRLIELSYHFRFISNPEWSRQDNKEIRDCGTEWINIEDAIRYMESFGGDDLRTAPDPQHAIHNVKFALRNPYFMHDGWAPRTATPVRTADGSYVDPISYASWLVADALAELNTFTSL